MRNSVQPAARLDRFSVVNASRLFSVIGFVIISAWSQQSQASGLWLLGWLGISEIQIVQTGSGTGPAKSAQPVSKAVGPALAPVLPTAAVDNSRFHSRTLTSNR